MKRLLFFLAPAALMAGCSQEIAPEEPSTRGKFTEIAPEITMRSLEGAIYNEITDSWMVPQADPFTLANVQAAYDKLAAGRSAQTLSKAQSAEFAVAKKLEPTHYALKIYPKTEEEQWRVEMMEDVGVAYIPFSYVQLRQEEVERLPQAKTKSIGTASAAAFTFAEKSPHTITCDYTESTDGGPTGPVTYQLPILYVVWPVEKPLPDDMEYEVDYPILLPGLAMETPVGKDEVPHIGASLNVAETLGGEAQGTLFGEAIALARGETAVSAQGASTRRFVMPPVGLSAYGDVTTYDNIVGRDIPLANLSVRLQYGSLIADGSTDINGHFSIAFPWPDQTLLPPSSFLATVTFTYIDPHYTKRWKIVPDRYNYDPTLPSGGYYDTVPYSVTRETGFENSFFYGEPPGLSRFRLVSSGRRENEIHRAVVYFFMN